MDKLEETLNENKLELNKLEAPENLENLLRSALDKKDSKVKTNKYFKIKAAATFITAILLIGYNFSALGYYAEKLVGYDQLMDSNLKRLNELGKGQTIGKSYTNKKGVTLTLDGVMLDDNQLIAFYTIKEPSGNIDNANIQPSNIYLKGKNLQYICHNSYGKINDKKTELKHIAIFDTPSIFDNNLILNIVFTENNKSEIGQIPFDLDKTKAMGHSVKKSLNKTVIADDINVKFQSITASPTTTVIKGNIKSILELAEDRMNGISFSPRISYKLLANGDDIYCQSGEVGSNLNGVTFKTNFAALPGELKKLQIQLLNVTSEHIVNKQIRLNKTMENQHFTIEDKNLEIKKIYESNGNTFITFSTEIASAVTLTKVNIIMDGKKVELKKTILGDSVKNNGVSIYTRTMEFTGTGNILELDIQRMLYTKEFNKIINIPLK